MTANPAAARLATKLMRNYHEVRIALNRLEFAGVEPKEAEALVLQWAAEGRSFDEASGELMDKGDTRE